MIVDDCGWICQQAVEREGLRSGCTEKHHKAVSVGGGWPFKRTKRLTNGRIRVQVNDWISAVVIEV